MSVSPAGPALGWVTHTASEDWLVKYCKQKGKNNGVVGASWGGNRVIKLSDDIAVKYGPGVTASEAATQEFAHRKANPALVHVPRVYRYFRRDADKDIPWVGPEGYLFMEYVSGQLMDELDLDVHSDIVPRVAKIIEHLGQIQMPDSQVPGPVGNDEPQGYLWGDDGARTVFTCRADMDAWLNLRLKTQNKSIDLTAHPLVLCHMDLCRRNMILKQDGTISLVDWGFAGLYPRFFEIASHSCLNPYDEPYEKPLIKATTALVAMTEEEERLMGLVQIARACNIRHSL
jgi:aminoglycoside phosphotransferase (APT) family kinase protein